jgi:hypothetical protein
LTYCGGADATVRIPLLETNNGMVTDQADPSALSVPGFLAAERVEIKRSAG